MFLNIYIFYISNDVIPALCPTPGALRTISVVQMGGRACRCRRSVLRELTVERRWTSRPTRRCSETCSTATTTTPRRGRLVRSSRPRSGEHQLFSLVKCVSRAWAQLPTKPRLFYVSVEFSLQSFTSPQTPPAGLLATKNKTYGLMVFWTHCPVGGLRLWSHMKPVLSTRCQTF